MPPKRLKTFSLRKVNSSQNYDDSTILGVPIIPPPLRDPFPELKSRQARNAQRELCHELKRKRAKQRRLNGKDTSSEEEISDYEEDPITDQTLYEETFSPFKNYSTNSINKKSTYTTNNNIITRQQAKRKQENDLNLNSSMSKFVVEAMQTGHVAKRNRQSISNRESTHECNESSKPNPGLSTLRNPAPTVSSIRSPMQVSDEHPESDDDMAERLARTEALLHGDENANHSNTSTREGEEMAHPSDDISDLNLNFTVLSDLDEYSLLNIMNNLTSGNSSSSTDSDSTSDLSPSAYNSEI